MWGGKSTDALTATTMLHQSRSAPTLAWLTPTMHEHYEGVWETKVVDAAIEFMVVRRMLIRSVQWF